MAQLWHVSCEFEHNLRTAGPVRYLGRSLHLLIKLSPLEKCAPALSDRSVLSVAPKRNCRRDAVFRHTSTADGHRLFGADLVTLW
jgi:hypothetical protein